MQVLGMTVIIGWCVANAIVLFIILKYTGIFRATKEEEERGMDVVKHGAYGYLFDYNPMTTEGQAAVNVQVSASATNGSNGTVAVVATKESNSLPAQSSARSDSSAAKNSNGNVVEMKEVVTAEVQNESSSSSSSSEATSDDSSQSNSHESSDSSDSSLNDWFMKKWSIIFVLIKEFIYNTNNE